MTSARHAPTVPPFWVMYNAPSLPSMHALGPPPQST